MVPHWVRGEESAALVEFPQLLDIGRGDDCAQVVDRMPVPLAEHDRDLLLLIRVPERSAERRSPSTST